MRHLLRRAARIRRRAELHHVRVRVLLHEGDVALAGAIVRIVLLRSDDPVPTEFVEVDRQLVTATATLVGAFRTAQTAPLCALFSLIARQNVDEWTLRKKMKMF